MSTAHLAGPRRILFVVTEDWYFVSHRLPLAIAARDAGYEVIIASRFGAQRERLESEGFALRPISLRRRGASPVQEMKAILELRQLFRDTRLPAWLEGCVSFTY
jgi:hypothetical protein